MAQKKAAGRKKNEIGEGYDLEVQSFEVRMSAGINVMPDSGCSIISLNDPLYEVFMTLEVMATCLNPARFEDDSCKVIMFSYERESWSDLRVADVQHKDENGCPKYLKRGRSVIPSFDPPRCIGDIWRRRKEDPWIASIAVPLFVVKDFHTALSRGQARYISLSVRRIGRERLIQRVSFSTPGLFDE